MRARCLKCNAAIDYSQQKGVKLSESKCLCGGSYALMRKRQVDGDAPLPGFTIELFGRRYHVVYSGPGGEWLYDRRNNCFVKIEKVSA